MSLDLTATLPGLLSLAVFVPAYASRSVYTFFAHLKWAWSIGLGYAASILAHLWISASLI